MVMSGSGASGDADLTEDHTVIRAEIIDLLMSTRDLAEATPQQYYQLIISCVHTLAWCVREEFNKNLLLAIAHAGGNPITKDVVDGLLDVAVKERVDHVTNLSAFANSLLAGFTKH